MNGAYRGIVLILIAYFLMTAETIAIHHVGTQATPLQFLLMRNLGCAVLVFALGWNARLGLAVFRTRTYSLQILRTLLTVVSLGCMYWGFAVLPIADATAITYTRAVFLSLMAAVFLGERISPALWGSIAVGILGGLLVLRPAFQAWEPAYLVALAGAALNAGSMVATKVLERRDSTLTIMAWLTLLSTLLCLPAALQPWPPADQLPWMLSISLLGSVGLYTGLLAIRATDLSILAPFDYTRLLMAAVFGLVLFQEVPNMGGLVGSAVIMLSCLVAARAQRRTVLAGARNRS